MRIIGLGECSSGVVAINATSAGWLRTRRISGSRPLTKLHPQTESRVRCIRWFAQMPCNSDHLEATHLEAEMSKVACLLDELDGKKRINRDHWRGYHPRVYSQRVNADEMTAELCSRLRGVDVSQCSLEMQIWWRDHQEADKRRAEKAIRKAKTEKQKKAALAKLTPHERKLLGL